MYPLKFKPILKEHIWGGQRLLEIKKGQIGRISASKSYGESWDISTLPRNISMITNGFLKNFASGLWDTYNNITGLLSDVLSYIRLFAIGLSGGVLAQVFNSLAMGLTGLDAGIEQFGVGTVFQILGATAILLVGHAINLFMSTISSFVHPMRLTFVEFYKNAGFEMTTRAFEPLTKEK